MEPAIVDNYGFIDKYIGDEIMALFENCDITKLDINRIYRYLDKYTKENVTDVDEVTTDDEMDD